MVKVGAVNCDKDKALCQQHRITGYPTIKAFRWAFILVKWNMNICGDAISKRSCAARARACDSSTASRAAPPSRNSRGQLCAAVW